jgi:hypothetical protein
MDLGKAGNAYAALPEGWVFGYWHESLQLGV